MSSTIASLDDDLHKEKDLDPAYHPSSVVEKGGLGVTDNEVNQPPWREVPPEVKACVPEVDDPEIPCETFRSYLLGTICAVVGTGLNTWYEILSAVRLEKC